MYAWTIVHHPVHPGVSKAVPYNAAVVRLFDCGGAKLITNLVGVKNEEITAGMKVKVEWDDITPEISLPRFRAVDAVKGKPPPDESAGAAKI